MIKLGITGASGRMGQTLIRLAAETAGVTLAAVCDRTGDPRALFAAGDVVIDFTSREASLLHAKLAAETGKALVIGTTGFTEDEKNQLRAFAKEAPILWSANMSIGVALLSQLVEQAARSLSEEYDIEIVEMHHKHKIDAPSGTALLLGEAAAKGRGVALNDKRVSTRDGHTGPRNPGDVGFAALRGGDVVGDHTVMFAGEGERIELSHKASSRDIFARGAIRAAEWLTKQKPGFYTIRDVLGL